MWLGHLPTIPSVLDVLVSLMGPPSFSCIMFLIIVHYTYTIFLNKQATKNQSSVFALLLNFHNESMKLVGLDGDSSQYTTEFLFDSDISTMEGLRNGHVFQPVFLNDNMLFPPHEVERIFDPVFDMYELSVQILASVEEIVEIASEMEEGARYPQIGFCFEDIAEEGYWVIWKKSWTQKKLIELHVQSKVEGWRDQTFIPNYQILSKVYKPCCYGND
uniref:Uncharacterized protein n=1 Tax=Amphimedon queenslandica TaxID=400682 RepID=A0A1X7T5V7_AMPQE